MSYQGSVEDIKCKIGVTIYDSNSDHMTLLGQIKFILKTGWVEYVTGRAEKLVVGSGPGWKGIGPGQIISARADLCCMLYVFRKLYLLLPVLNRHICYLVGARLVLFLSCSPIIFGKSNQNVTVNSKRFKNGRSNVSARSFSLLPLAMQKCLLTRVYNLHLYVLSRISYFTFFLQPITSAHQDIFYLQPVSHYISHLI